MSNDGFRIVLFVLFVLFDRFRRRVMARFFEIGSSRVSLDEVCRREAPSNEEMAKFCHLLGLQISNGVPVLPSLALTATAVPHPWLVMVTSLAFNGVREGDSIAGSIQSGIKTLVKERITLLHSRLLEISPQGKPDVGRQSSNGGSSQSGIVFKLGEDMPSLYANLSKHAGKTAPPVRFNCRDWLLPDFVGHFELFVHMIDLGEETGELDMSLFSLRDYYSTRAVGVERFYPCDENLRVFLSGFSMLVGAGLPLLRSLRILMDSSIHNGMYDEIAGVCERIESGSTLSEAFEGSNGVFHDPILVGLIRSGEVSGALDVILKRLV